MEVIKFDISGRFGHFQRAETGGTSAPSYPVPPRTAILGVIGAIIGLQKDSPQKQLEPAYIELKGKIPATFDMAI